MNLFEQETIRIFEIFAKHHVEFILVGGLAVNYYGFARATGDIDLWIHNSPENRKNFILSLKEYGVIGAENLLDADFIPGFTEIALNNGIYIDLMDALQSFKPDQFIDAYAQAEVLVINNIAVRILNLDMLLLEKGNSKRTKDMLDYEEMKKIRDKRS